MSKSLKKYKFKLDRIINGILYELMSWVDVCAGTLVPINFLLNPLIKTESTPRKPEETQFI